MKRAKKLLSLLTVLILVFSLFPAMSLPAATAVSWADEPGVAMTSAGTAHTLALKEDGTLWAFGNNANGRLGNGSQTPSNVPVQVGAGNVWSFISAGAFHNLAIRDDGSLWAWGANGSGELGLGETGGNRLVPTRVGTHSDWVHVSAGMNFSLGIREISSGNRQLFAWGTNFMRQLGLGDSFDSVDNVNTPHRVGTWTNWILAEASGNFSLGIRGTPGGPAQNTLWGWGTNTDGQFGNGGTSASNAPVPAGLIAGTPQTGWISLTLTASRAGGIRIDDGGDRTAWFWGGGIKTPALTGAGAGVQSISAGSSADQTHTLVVLGDGRLLSWGSNNNGQLGIGSRVNQNLPTQVGNYIGWVYVYAGATFSTAIRQNGNVRELWTWGGNGSGQLGNGHDDEVRTSPVRIWPTGNGNGNGNGNDEFCPICDGKMPCNPCTTCDECWVVCTCVTVCQDCGLHPCECCDDCGEHPCECCTVCEDYPCKCCEVCEDYPCKCCPECEIYPCKCCLICEAYPCKCCEICELYPCECPDPPPLCPYCEEPEDDCVCEPEPTPPPEIFSGIDHASVRENHVIVPAVTFSYEAVPGQGGLPSAGNLTPNDELYINLTTETLHIAGKEIQAYSIRTNSRNERVWRTGTINLARFSRMLNRGLDLWICFRDFNPNARKPQGSGDVHNIIAFAQINARPRAPRVAINFYLDQDRTGQTPGFWLLTNRPRRGEQPILLRDPSIQLAIPLLNHRNRPTRLPNELGWGQFYPEPHKGIPVAPLPAADERGRRRPVREAFIWRVAPARHTDGELAGTFTPASTTRIIRANGERRPPNIRVRERTSGTTITVRANTFVSINEAAPIFYPARTVIDVLEVTGRIEIWQAATPNGRRPATAIQTITRG